MPKLTESYEMPYDYLISLVGGNVFAKTGTGAGKYRRTDSDAFALINTILVDDAAARTFKVRPAAYTFAAPLSVPDGKHGFGLLGSGWGKSGTFGDPTTLYGTVFQSSVVDIDAIQLNGYLTGLKLKDFAVKFTGATTGHGIDGSLIDVDNGLLFSEFDNILMKGVDTAHYGYYFKNFAHLVTNRLYGFHGGYMKLEAVDSAAHYAWGNSVFNAGYWETDMKSVMAIPALHLVADAGGRLNLLQFNRPQLTVKNSVAASPWLKIDKVYDVLWNALDLEGTALAAQEVITGVDARYNHFKGGYIYDTAGLGVINFDTTSHSVHFGARTVGILKKYLQGYDSICDGSESGVSERIGSFIQGYDTTLDYSVDAYRGTPASNWIQQYLRLKRGAIGRRNMNYGEAITQASTTQQINLIVQMADANYGVLVVPSTPSTWDANIRVHDKATDHFHITYAAAPANATVDWILFA
jgi:hypothetical protein